MSVQPVTRPGSAGANRASRHPRPRTARLQLAPPVRKNSPRTPFVLLIVGLLGFGLLALLLLNTSAAQGAFRLNTLQTQSSALEDEQQALAQRAAQLADPANLAAAAARLGMVPGGPPQFLLPHQGTAGGYWAGNLYVVPAPKATRAPAAAAASTAKSVTAVSPSAKTGSASTSGSTTASTADSKTASSKAATSKTATSTTRTAHTPTTQTTTAPKSPSVAAPATTPATQAKLPTTAGTPR